MMKLSILNFNIAEVRLVNYYLCNTFLSLWANAWKRKRKYDKVTFHLYMNYH